MFYTYIILGGLFKEGNNVSPKHFLIVSLSNMFFFYKIKIIQANKTLLFIYVRIIQILYKNRPQRTLFIKTTLVSFLKHSIYIHIYHIL